MRRRFHNRAIKWDGPTAVWTVRLPEPVSEFLLAQIGTNDLKTKSECLQDAAALWAMSEERDNA